MYPKGGTTRTDGIYSRTKNKISEEIIHKNTKIKRKYN